MPSLKVTIAGDSDPLAREFNKVNGMANRFGREIVQAGRMSRSAMGELLVIMREIGRGNWARVPGSLTLLLQRMGVDLLKIFTSVPGIIAAAGAAIAYFTYKHLKDLNEALDKTSELLAEGFGDRLKANFEALKESTEAAADFNSWLAKLGHTQETLAEQTDEAIAKLREQFELMRQIAGSDKASAASAEQAERRDELEMINKNLEQQKFLAEQSREAAIQGEGLAKGDKAALERLGKIKDLPSELAKAEENVKKFGPIVDELRAKVDARNKVMYSPLYNTNGSEYGGPGANARRFADTDAESRAIQYTVKSGEPMSLDIAERNLENNKNALKSGRQLEIELEDVQRQLVDAMREAKEKAQKDAEAVERLTKERDKLSDQIELHARLDPIQAADQQLQESLQGKSRATQKSLLEDAIDLHKQNAEFFRSVGDRSADISAEGEELEADKLQKQLQKLDAKKAHGSIGPGILQWERAGGMIQGISVMDVQKDMLTELKGIRRAVSQKSQFASGRGVAFQ